MSCSHAPVNNQLHHELAKLTLDQCFKDHFILTVGESKKNKDSEHFLLITVLPVHLTAKVHHDKDDKLFLHNRMALTDGQTDVGGVTGPTAALLHTGKSFYWRLSS